MQLLAKSLKQFLTRKKKKNEEEGKRMNLNQSCE